MSLDRYRLRSQLGAGPDGVAYRAVGEDGDTEVEVVDLEPARQDPRRWKVLAHRLRVAAQLEHPSVIRILELDLEHNRPYAVLEWVGATTLATSVAANGPKSRQDAIAIAGDLAAALKAAHRLGLPHGWLAPDQVLLVGGTEPKLNFGGAMVGFPSAQNRSTPSAVPLLNLAQMKPPPVRPTCTAWVRSSLGWYPQGAIDRTTNPVESA